MAQPLTLRLKRPDSGTSWGFRLQGGIDFSNPLSVQMVNPGSIAELSGLRAGDGILMINNTNTDSLTHEQAKMEIIRSGNEINLLIQRGAVTIWKPTVTPLSELRPSELKPIISATGEEIVAVQKTSLAKEKPDDICSIGSSHNRSARPFGAGAASAAHDSGPSVIHAQFNSPIGMYSAENLAETYSDQASSLRENMANMNVSGQAGRPQPMNPASAPGENSQASNVSSDEVLPHDGHATTFGRLEDELNKKEVDTFAKDLPTGFRSVSAPKTDYEALQKQQQQIQQMRCGGCDMLVTGVFVKAGNKPYHPGCFKCTTCGIGLKQKGYFVIEGKMYCETHARRHAQPPGPDMVAVPVYR